MNPFFNTAGPMIKDDHYSIDPLERVDWEEIRFLISAKRYFVLHAPRQTGKTSTMMAMTKALNDSGEYIALYANIEAAQIAGNDADKGIFKVCSALAEHSSDNILTASLQNIFRAQNNLPPDGNPLSTLLSEWAKSCNKPCVVFLDEVDSLVGETLLSLLRQIRAGYARRPIAFPQSIILSGVRDVRDSRFRTGSSFITGDSAFNIKSESIRMANFTYEEVNSLFTQHNSKTGQACNPEVIKQLWDDTLGQPWLVNAIGHQLVWKVRENRDRNKVIDIEDYRMARETLIESSATHIDQLSDKLKEDSVRSVISPILEGESEQLLDAEDVNYVIDIGLVTRARNGALTIANRLYQEVIPRELSWGVQMGLEQLQTWYVNDDNTLDMAKVLSAFPLFFKQNADEWFERFNYKAVGPQLLAQAFLQRIVSGGGGRIVREYALGRKRTDLLLEWPLTEDGFYGEIQHIVVELKTLRGSLGPCIEEGLKHVTEHADLHNAAHAHLIVFNREEEQPWENKIWQRAHKYNDRLISIWGC